MSRFANTMLSLALLGYFAFPILAGQNTGAQNLGNAVQPPASPVQPPASPAQPPANPVPPAGKPLPASPAPAPGAPLPANPAIPVGKPLPASPTPTPGAPLPANPALPPATPLPASPVLQPGAPLPASPVLPPGTPLSAYPEVPLAKLPPVGTQPPATQAQPQGQASSVIMGQVTTANPGFSGNQVTQTPWSNQAAVQKHLNLTNEQINKLNAVHNEAWNQYKADFDKTSSLTAQQRTEQGINVSGAYNNQVNQSTQSTLNPQQYQRYEQLQLQYHGLNAFSDQSVQQKLNLTAPQIQKLQTFDNAQAQRWAEMYKSVGYNPDRARASYQSMVGQNDNLIRQVLSPQQQQTWNSMVGAPYPFEPHWGNSSK